MIELMKQKGFTCSPTNEYGDGFYMFNDQMLKDKVVFLYVLLERVEDETIVCQDYISVYHYNDLDAMEWQLYWNDTLVHMQVYRMLMDIYDVYRVFPLERFITMLPDLSIGGYTASMRREGDTTPVQKTDRYIEIKKLFHGLKIETN